MSHLNDCPCAVIITAAGTGSRIGGETRKQFRFIGGKPIFINAAIPFINKLSCGQVIFTVPKESVRGASELADHYLETDIRSRCSVIAGGETRQNSVYNGLEHLRAFPSEFVMIHDAARPWVSEELIAAVYKGALQHGACAPVISLHDTVKGIDSNGFVKIHYERSALSRIQTPQTFRFSDILSAHRRAKEEEFQSTDDTALYDRYCGKVFTIPGDPGNRKITYPWDIPAEGDGAVITKSGFGYDIHPLAEGRPLILGGITIPFPRGEEGHSDGDAPLHALMDALFGAASLDDIGTHFPPEDPVFKGADSIDLLRKTVQMVSSKNHDIIHTDITIIIEKPKLRPFVPEIRKKIAGIMGVPYESVSVKAKTKEGFAPVGTGEAVEAYASVTLVMKAEQK
jgi:2-C-methyl-D-erythritol 4-phosphate cytidylyltransferase / 2-C-methyl-D-erythritol 2,4-cyclodiphosphate synthase